MENKTMKLFSEGKLTVSEAANLAGLSVGEMMDELREAGISPKIKVEDLEGSFEEALKVIR